MSILYEHIVVGFNSCQTLQYIHNHSITNTSKFTQQCNVVPYFLCSLLAATSQFSVLIPRKCNCLAGIMVIPEPTARVTNSARLFVPGENVSYSGVKSPSMIAGASLWFVVHPAWVVISLIS